MMTSWDDDEDDDFLFEDDDDMDQVEEEKHKWVMLIVDDEPGIHDVTRLALNRFSYEGRGLELISAFNAQEALDIMKTRQDIAVVLLDVVMETDHAGLDCARKIRDEINNDLVRIVLRTGQPGQAPEEEVILAYDINDYRAKTELTAERLFTTVVSALRSYNDLIALESYREDAYGILAQNTQTIQSLIDLSDVPLFQLGHDLLVQRCNQAFADLLQSDMNELIGFPMPETVPLELTQNCKNNEETTINLNGQNYELKLALSQNAICASLTAETQK